MNTDRCLAILKIIRYNSRMRCLFCISLFLCFSLPFAAEGALEMPAMPSMPDMPSMPNTDEKMAGRKALEAKSNLYSSGALNKNGKEDQAAKPSLNEGASALENPSAKTVVPAVPVPSSTSPISSFGTPLSDYSDIDALLRRLSSQKDAPIGVTGAAPAVMPSSAWAEQKETASILRFVINGNDVRAACRNVHFSTVEDDGSFLLTAERRYWANGVSKIEPFYMLFTSQGLNSRSYNVTCSVVKESEEESFLSRLCAIASLTAAKTGNLVSMKTGEDGIYCDLLLDIGK